MALVILVMSIGYMSSGALADLLFKRTKSGRLIISLIGISLAFVFLILAVTSPLGNHLLFTIFTVAMAFFMTFAGPQTPATIADITLPGARSTALSIQYLVENSSAALAPFLAGLIAVKTSLGQAMLIISFAWLIAALFIAFAAFFVPRDHARMHQQLSLRAAAQEPAKGETK
jgi:MFS family permease